MFGSRSDALRMTISLLTSTLSTLLIEQRWKAGILIALAGAASILLLSVALAIARAIERKFGLDRVKKKAAKPKAARRRPRSRPSRSPPSG
jgi:hypothetical protein